MKYLYAICLYVYYSHKKTRQYTLIFTPIKCSKLTTVTINIILHISLLHCYTIYYSNTSEYCHKVFIKTFTKCNNYHNIPQYTTIYNIVNNKVYQSIFSWGDHHVVTLATSDCTGISCVSCSLHVRRDACMMVHEEALEQKYMSFDS